MKILIMWVICSLLFIIKILSSALCFYYGRDNSRRLCPKKQDLPCSLLEWDTAGRGSASTGPHFMTCNVVRFIWLQASPSAPTCSRMLVKQDLRSWSSGVFHKLITRLTDRYFVLLKIVHVRMLHCLVEYKVYFTPPRNISQTFDCFPGLCWRS
jgi:hypothetical protein